MKFIQNAKGILENVTGYDPKLLHCLNNHGIMEPLKVCTVDTANNELIHGHLVKAIQINNTLGLNEWHNAFHTVGYVYHGVYQTVHFVTDPIHSILFH